MDVKVLYEDKDIIIIEKLPGMSAEQDEDGDDALTAAKSLCGVTCYPVHRLDKATGGALMLAKNRGAAASLSALLSEHKVEKEYLAVVHGAPAQSQGEMTDLLFYDRSKRKAFVVKRERRGVKEARLSYSLISCTSDNSGHPISLMAIQLHTGRTHQIRVQLASRGFPLLGDRKYGSRDSSCTTALWCRRISFSHPVTGKTVTVFSDPPDTYPWNRVR